MRILMLGWEFPPFIAGGLGVACYGLTKALDRLGHEVIFVLPKAVERSHASHVRLMSPGAQPPPEPFEPTEEGTPLYGFQHAVFRGVTASFGSPYPAFEPGRLSRLLGPGALDAEGVAGAGTLEDLRAAMEELRRVVPAPTAGGAYGSDLIGDSERYARLVVAITAGERFDVIHAHDWLTYPAGLALARLTGRPLVVHVHSTEFDRSGSNVNQRIYDIEREGMHGADRVIAVSQLTRSICVRRYGVDPARIDVVYNGIDRELSQPAQGAAIESTDKIVLFLGRITMQKGPEYFIAAAKRVLERFPDVKFVLAGSGDMAERMIELAANMGIGHKVVFTGFLRGRDVERVFAMADCYVMPSVSEPFGIAALEAIHHDVPVIISKQSGAAEVLTHVLKVDFWDIDEMANKILAVLRHPSLSQVLREHGKFELHRLTWHEAAERTLRTYHAAARR